MTQNIDVYKRQIQKLPHHLVQAFRATLEELQYADILLHVVDASDANRAEHIEVVYDLSLIHIYYLKEIDIERYRAIIAELGLRK